MGSTWFYISVFLELLATVGLVLFAFKQKKTLFWWSYWILSAGFVCHTVFWVYRYYLSSGAAPVIHFKEALSFFSWSIIGVYLVFQLKFRLKVLGSFVAPLALFLMILSSTMPWIEVPVKPVFRSLWLTIHIAVIFAGNGMLAIGFMAAVMYLIQEYHIKHKRMGAFFNRLPSLATLDTVNYYSVSYGFAFITLGMVAGSVYAQQVLGAYWQWDPKEVWSLITWLFYAALIHQRLAAGWQGRKAAVLSIICFLILIFTFAGVSHLLGGYHSFRSLGLQEAL
ncbi:MAG: c-type cytochrome biogenesis protein CcsB [Deltaproteobacteria bacterium]|nr:c-type cytochrome biogenesis protein CcsB [Deltaproteobacteria bacterium]